MSFYEDQEEDWIANECKGSPSDYDGAGNYTVGFSNSTTPSKYPSKSAKRRAARLRKKAREMKESDAKR
jgi:hypothetical protein